MGDEPISKIEIVSSPYLLTLAISSSLTFSKSGSKDVETERVGAYWRTISSKPKPLHTVRRVRIESAMDAVDSVFLSWPHNPFSRKAAPTSSVVGKEDSENNVVFAAETFSAMRTAGSIVVVVVSGTLFPEAHDETRTDTAIALNNEIFIWFFRFNQLTEIKGSTGLLLWFWHTVIDYLSHLFRS